VVVTIRVTEGQRHTVQVVRLNINIVTIRDVGNKVAVHLNINSVTIRDVDSKVVVHLNISNVIIRGVDIQVVVNLNINRVTIRVRDVVVHAPEGVVCRSHTMAGIREGVVESVFHQVRQEQFPSCTKPRMSNIKPRWFHHLHRVLAHPLSLWLR
jgi:hypothetical protein